MKDPTPEDLEALRVRKAEIEAEHGPAPGRSGGPLEHYISGLIFNHLTDLIAELDEEDQ